MNTGVAASFLNMNLPNFDSLFTYRLYIHSPMGNGQRHLLLPKMLLLGG